MLAGPAGGQEHVLKGLHRVEEPDRGGVEIRVLHNVLKKIGASAYTLDLPEAWKRVGIHPTFNVKLLIPYHRPQFPSQQTPPPPPPEVVNDHEEYEVQEVLDSRMRRGMIQYLVKWKGYAMAIRMLPRSQQEYGGISVVLSEISELDFRVITGNLID